jgi:hypothetical protein
VEEHARGKNLPAAHGSTKIHRQHGGQDRDASACALPHPAASDIQLHPTSNCILGDNVRISRSKRQCLFRDTLGCLALAAFVLGFAGRAEGESPIRSINVAHDGEAYICDLVMFAPVQPAIAWDVLTDFEHMADWVPNVRESTVLKRENNAVIIEQRGLAKFGAASFPYATERRMEMNQPATIRSTQLKGSMRRVESLMQMEPEANGARLTYHLEIVPSFFTAAILSKSFLEHELAEQFGAIIGEMIRRAK